MLETRLLYEFTIEYIVRVLSTFTIALGITFNLCLQYQIKYRIVQECPCFTISSASKTMWGNDSHIR